jgi:hypothetical protein
MPEIRDKLISKIKMLSDTVWDRRATTEEVNKWLNNFNKGENDGVCEQLHALYLLSKFMYFSSREIKELSKSVYRDLFKYPIVENIRKEHADTTDISLIRKQFKRELNLTRFIPVGNPSESGAHILYYFRQENSLPGHLFINDSDIFKPGRNGKDILISPSIQRYVFIDDFCGSGTQAADYLSNHILKIKSINPNIVVDYYMLFATDTGLNYLINNTMLNKCNAVFKLDDSFKCFSQVSRYNPSAIHNLDWQFTKKFVEIYGMALLPGHALGFRDCQLLLGFFHNTPDNSLPIFWSDKSTGIDWEPIFRRHTKT